MGTHELTKVPQELYESWAAAVGSDHVLAAGDINEDYSVDESLHPRAVSPIAVLRPQSTAEVAAVVRAAREHRVPLTARGAGTGLSEACIASPGGAIVSFERMNQILKVDAASHTAVVEPGVTLAELNAEAARVDLVYPVFPGTDSASIGGTIATNAGGMRAVKYGVTRNNVLGVEAVTGTGDVLRCGGAFVKNTTGYDLTQLVIGSEGTLALVTQATVKLSPLMTLNATLLAPFADVDTVAEVIPRTVVSGTRPKVLEYIDRSTMKALLRFNDLGLGITEDIAAKTEAYLLVEIEGRTPQQLEEDLELLAEMLTGAGAYDVYVLADGKGAKLIEARESAFWMVKAAGADDLIDMVVPRHLIPDYLRGVQTISDELGSRVFGCGHAGDGNIHFSVYEPDDNRRHDLLMRIYEMGLAMGGAISGEHGIGLGKKSYYQALQAPETIALQRLIKGAFDPAGILNPGKIFDPA